MSEYDKGVKDTMLTILGIVFYIMTCISWANIYTGTGLLFVITYIIIPILWIIIIFSD